MPVQFAKLPLNPGGWPACPKCLSGHLYYAPHVAATACSACHYTCPDDRMAAGERIWWERAAVLTANGIGLSGRGRPVCPTCSGHRFTFRNGAPDLLECIRCSQARSRTGEPLMDDALLKADEMRAGLHAQEPVYPEVVRVFEPLEPPVVGELPRVKRRMVVE